MFVDRVQIEVRAGDGGAGVAAFLRQKGRPRGKPTGGSGGPGGDVVLVADPDVASLLSFARHPHWSAAPGTHGEGDLRHGRRGADRELPVPLGTVVRDASGMLLADLVDPGQRIVVARGGRGGKGNAAFVDRAHRAPGFSEQGEYGERATLTLELRLIADAALVGFPNAGKSTLISRLSAAKPKIADYPFTTLEPHLGVVDLGDRQYVLADIPGLIEGAAEGRGLGHEFLRHTERARVLVVLVDPTPMQTEDVAIQLAVLRRELALHSPDLAARPQIVAVTKADLVEGPEADLPGEAEVHRISAVTGAGLSALSAAIADAVDQEVRTAPEREGYVLHRPLPPSFMVRREEGGRWVVEGRAATRAVGLADLTVPEAADLAAARLRRLGVDDALSAAGAAPGDDVRIGDLVFTYAPDDDEAEDDEG